MNRERLTITLKSDLLKTLDELIDGQRLRNRSHAIEYFLSKSLAEKETKVLILAGGNPVFFKSAGKLLPKAMVSISGKPLLEHTLIRLKEAKMKDVVISVGEGGEEIREYFKTGSKWGISITYLEQSKSVKGTAQALAQAKELMKEGDFLLVYGDVLSEINFVDFYSFHQAQKNSVCTMALSSAETVSMWGLAKMQGSKILNFEEKPEKPKTFSHLVNAGMYFMKPSIFSRIPSTAVKLESDVFPRLAEENKLSGYAFEGLWIDVSSDEEYKKALKKM